MIIERYTKRTRIIAIVLVTAFFLSILVSSTMALFYADEPVETAPAIDAAQATTSIPEELVETQSPAVPLIDVPVLFPDLHYISLYDIVKCNEQIGIVREAVTEVDTAINSGEYTEAAVLQMQQEVTRLYSIISYTEADIRHYTKWEDDYYYAAKTFEFLCSSGYSEIVACAIIGNMMIETSGGSLNLHPHIYSYDGGFYGLCQWSLYYRPGVAGMSFEDQLEYLYNDMEREFNAFGSCYRSGFGYEDFMVMEDPAEAAIAFAKVYERCGSGTYGLRQNAAIQAYDYFHTN